MEPQSNMTVKFSCVLDQREKFARQAFVWVSSLLKYAGQEPDSILIHFVNRLNPTYKRIFDSWGIKTQMVKPFDSRHPHSNKLAQLESEAGIAKGELGNYLHDLGKILYFRDD
jgi:hypothetical protein